VPLPQGEAESEACALGVCELLLQALREPPPLVEREMLGEEVTLRVRCALRESAAVAEVERLPEGEAVVAVASLVVSPASPAPSHAAQAHAHAAPTALTAMALSCGSLVIALGSTVRAGVEFDPPSPILALSALPFRSSGSSIPAGSGSEAGQQQQQQQQHSADSLAEALLRGVRRWSSAASLQ
jgi:hypothetical protein